MQVVDASCLYEVVVGRPRAERIRQRLASDPDFGAPHVIDVEVLNTIRRESFDGRLDPTLSQQAIEDLRDWPGERFEHRGLIWRAWELRANVRGWDAFYVALAEALGATLLTLDGRLSRATGPACRIELISD